MDIHGAVHAIGLALLVLFFVVGVMRTCGNFAEVKRPEQALKGSLSYCQFAFSELHVLILILIMRIVNRKIRFLRIYFCRGPPSQVLKW